MSIEYDEEDRGIRVDDVAVSHACLLYTSQQPFYRLGHCRWHNPGGG